MLCHDLCFAWLLSHDISPLRVFTHQVRADGEPIEARGRAECPGVLREPQGTYEPLLANRPNAAVPACFCVYYLP